MALKKVNRNQKSKLQEITETVSAQYNQAGNLEATFITGKKNK